MFQKCVKYCIILKIVAFVKIKLILTIFSKIIFLNITSKKKCIS